MYMQKKDHNTSILDFQPPELWKNKFLLSPPVLCYFVMATQASSYSLLENLYPKTFHKGQKE